MTFKVANYNKYPTCHIITITIDADSVTSALDEAEQIANNWNKEAEDAQVVNAIFCNGYIRNV